MGIERDRGISVVTSVMTFEYGDCVFNLLDTPGHEDFSEDTYRTLTAVDSAVMVIDAAKGIEARTRKLFEVCRLRDIPIVTFINKIDRETRDPFDLLDEIEKTLALDTAPVTWPIGRGRSFAGTYDLRHNSFRKLDEQIDATPVSGPDDPLIRALLPEHEMPAFLDEVDLAMAGCKPFDQAAFLEGHLTPVFFGSALRNFGVRDLIDALSLIAPPPRGLASARRFVEAREPRMTGFVFKIQANMDPNHRDRIAFFRICSGRYAPGLRMYHVRLDKDVRVADALTFMAGDRSQAQEAYAGDIIGLHNHGTINIGDTFTEGETLGFTGIPSFAPEMFRRAVLKDPLKAKALAKGLGQLCEEGATQLFRPLRNNDMILGAVGQLQFEVVAFRLQDEYSVQCAFETIGVQTARWVYCDDERKLQEFRTKAYDNLAVDHSGALVYLAPSRVNLALTLERWPDIDFRETREIQS
jgi:peptide chain release factor 3